MRIFRLVATPILLLGLLGFLVWGAFWGWKSLTSPLPSPSPTPCVTTTPKAVVITDVAVRVFNGGFQSGLAHRVSTQLRDAGMRVIKTDNTEERIKGTVLRTNESSPQLLRLVASYFKDAKVEYDDRIDGTIDVLVGSDFQGFGDKPLKSVTAGKTLCVMPTPSVTPTTSPTSTAKQPSPTATRTP